MNIEILRILKVVLFLMLYFWFIKNIILSWFDLILRLVASGNMIRMRYKNETKWEAGNVSNMWLFDWATELSVVLIGPLDHVFELTNE